MIDAVIFDLDGVLLDSESAWLDAKRAVVDEWGGTWQEEASRAMLGMSAPEWSVYMRDDLAIDRAPQEIDAEVVEGMKPDDKPAQGAKNDPMNPVAWTKTYDADNGKVARVFTTTMGASQDLQWEGTRRMIVNGCFWAAGLEAHIPEKSKVDVVGTFEPLPFKFGGHKKGVKPADLGK